MQRILFGDYVFDVRARLLTRRGRLVHATPKALQLLEILLRSRPSAVSKIGLIDHLWPETFVSEHSLTSLVSEVRKALGGDAFPSIRTIHGFGYAFCADAAVLPSSARDAEQPTCFLVESGPHACRFGIYEGVTVIGRASSSDVWIAAPTLSRRHARIRSKEGTAVIEDLGSRHGTLVEGKKVTAPTPLREGDHIRFGCVQVVFRVAGASDADTDDLPGAGPA